MDIGAKIVQEVKKFSERFEVDGLFGRTMCVTDITYYEQNKREYDGYERDNTVYVWLKVAGICDLTYSIGENGTKLLLEHYRVKDFKIWDVREPLLDLLLFLGDLMPVRAVKFTVGFNPNRVQVVSTKSGYEYDLEIG